MRASTRIVRARAKVHATTIRSVPGSANQLAWFPVIAFSVDETMKLTARCAQFYIDAHKEFVKTSIESSYGSYAENR
jgi:hypothetical protein